MLALALLAVSILLLSQVLGQACMANSPCPWPKPCCDRSGWCSSEPSDCILGCQPYISHNVSACAPNPVCQDGSTDFRQGVDRVRQGEEEGFDNDPEDYDWAVLGRTSTRPRRDNELESPLVEQDEGVRLVAQPRYDSQVTTGYRLSSVRYLHYGTVDVVMQTARWQGMTTNFMLISDNRENIRFDTDNGNTTHVQATQGILGQSEFSPGSNFTQLDIVREGFFNDTEVIEAPGDTAAEFHKYTLDWQPEYIRWLIDDEQVRRLDKDDVDTSGGNRYPDMPARVEFSLRATRPYTTDPEFNELEYYWMTIQSVNVRCGDSSAGSGDGEGEVTGWAYRAEGSAEQPAVRTTDREVTISSSGSIVSVGKMAWLLSVAGCLLGLVIH